MENLANRLQYNIEMARRFIFIIVLLELFLGGGGRIIDVGEISIRMFLFSIIMVITLFRIWKRKMIDKDALLISIVSILFLLISSLIGAVNGASLNAIFTDVKPLIFIIAICYFYTEIKEQRDVELTISLLKFSSLALAFSYILIFSLINLKLIPLQPIYKWAEPTQEFFFRGEFAFFYKGFLFMCTGLFFYFFSNKTFSKLWIIILAIAILLTFTRGFILSIGLATMVYTFFSSSTIKRKLANTLLIIITMLLAWSFITLNLKLDKDKSDADRIVQINEVKQRVTPTSFIIGHGFGIGIPSRPVHMEISYLEIFHKQGILGLALWAILFFYGIYLYRKVPKNQKHLDPFYLSFLFVFAQSLTNPFINNPIGLTIIILSLSVFKVLSRENNTIIYG
jgi:hypothetical protein